MRKNSLNLLASDRMRPKATVEIGALSPPNGGSLASTSELDSRLSRGLLFEGSNTMRLDGLRFLVCVAVIFCTCLTLTHAQARQPAGSGNGAPPVLPKGYVIGSEDILSIVVWREKDMSADVVVRPDGKISLPLFADVQAAGYTPEQLAEVIEKAAVKYVMDPDVTVIVKEIHSRKVFVLGDVAKPGAFPLTSEMNVLQLIASVGGLLEFADKRNILILRIENGRERRLRFNYNDVIDGKNLQQNIMLQPGDTVLVK
jgi:polysaccharide export outer membrane protein